MVAILGAVDDRVACIVAQVPVCGAKIPDIDPSKEILAAISETLNEGDIDPPDASAIEPPGVAGIHDAPTGSTAPAQRSLSSGFGLFDAYLLAAQDLGRTKSAKKACLFRFAGARCHGVPELGQDRHGRAD